MPPIADAGLPRYAAYDPVVLDGTGSYDPDSSGSLSYAWRQIGGPPVVIIDANTATPTIGGSAQTGMGRRGLIAHWALDETEGSVAYDSAGGKDGTLNGDPAWQSTAGQIDGALAFDGTDDYVNTDFVLNPAVGAFSVFAWVKGGMPGQVIFSQAGLSDWLGADTTSGSLMTELKFIGKASRPLQSQTVITDGNWHRIGLVWDGSNGILFLYVDGVEVAADAYDKGYLVGDLQIGAGKNLDPGTFWSGLIDDVRIYNRALAKMGDFIQTDAIQECEFELVVSDGELTSLPDTVKVIVVPAFGNRLPELKNDSFDPDKPTFIFFGGGDCVTGPPKYAQSSFRDPPWFMRANIIEFPKGYWPDNSTGPPTYYQCGDMIIVYLSAVAPDYKQLIQSVGHSTGGMPAIDVGIHLNLTYADRRYAVNRVTLLDCGCRTASGYSSCIDQFLVNSVDGEQCWVDNYESGAGEWLSLNGLSVYATFGHVDFWSWYGGSLTNADTNTFNNGVVAGAYWSVAGPGKNLQLGPEPGRTYTFQWHGSRSSGHMDFYDEPNHPGRLPEPVTLVGPSDGAIVDATGAVLSCEVSENTVGYQLLFGRDPYHMVYLFSDTPSAPGESVTAFPFEQCWWTVRAYDEYGSTIHADPMHIKAESVIAQTIENATTGQIYASIQQAINDALAGDAIVVSPGAYQYLENINFKGKNITLRSTDPNDSAVVAATVINGGHRGPVVTFSGGEEASCVLAGFTITGGIVGISCRDASPTIRNCTIESSGPNAIEFWEGYEPTIIDCTILGQVVEVNDPTLVAHWKLDETEGDIAYDSAGENDGTLYGDPVWEPTTGQIDGALAFDGTDDYVSTDFVLNPADGAFSVFAWIKEGAPGQVIISQADRTVFSATLPGSTWLSTDPAEGKFMTELQGLDRAGCPLVSQTLITDGNWHRVGLTWDGSNRVLYVDGVEVAKDTQPQFGSSRGGLYIGAGNNLEPGSFFSGLIDDVRIYNRTVTP